MDTILRFLRRLEENNNKGWFDSHKDEYLEARSHFYAIVEKLLKGISSFDSTIKGIGINDCTYRIYKDMRFSKGGLPYKTHFGAFIAREGRKSGYSGYYFHIGTGSGDEYPCRSFLAAGNYYTEPRVLKILREDIEMGDGDFDNNLDIGRICDVFRSAKPFLDYINRAIEFTREDNLGCLYREGESSNPQGVRES